MACTCSRKLFQVLWGEWDKSRSGVVAPSRVENMPHVYPSNLDVEDEGGLQRVQIHQLVAKLCVFPGRVTHTFLGSCIVMHAIDTCHSYVLAGEKYFISHSKFCI